MTAVPLDGEAAPARASKEALLKSAVSKNIIQLIPILAIAYFFNYIDRTNVGFAALTMNRDLGLSNAQFGAAAGLFFVGYCLLEVPSNLALYRFGARRWLARIMISWGLLSAACALVNGPTSFYILRIATGAAEAGFFPGVLFYLSCWFPAESRVRVLAWFLIAIPVSSVIGGPLSVGILALDGMAGLKGWQWLFILEGIPACLMGVITLVKLRDDPKDADWLTEDERAVLIEALAQESASRPKKNFLAAIRDRKVIILTGILFSYWIGINGIAIWLPLILKTHGLNNLEVGFLSGAPYLVAAVAMIFWARFMEKTGQYLLNMVAACLLAGAGLAFSVFYGSLAPAMVGLTMAVIGLSSVRPAFYSLPSRYLTGAAAAGGLAFINSVGSLGGYVGPWMVGVLKDETGSFEAGTLAMAGMLVVAAALTLLLKRVAREN
ncbi:MFS transporter [Azospirillum cavernae]|uniref:MFS transporter n=1 Tax=Azospirillum cavernae TaxID=2320860 RepID=A0A418W514_9PROT|nr:MFS transporter [Azospirillum cavernae]RJF85109.1 MFS transporter [Azospirillum cavernae]